MIDNLIKPKTLDDAIESLRGKDKIIIAGGTDLVVEMRQGKLIKETILDISTLKELKHIGEENGKIVVGAGCTHSEIEKNSLLIRKVPLLSKGSSLVGSTGIRNRATIGGNVINASNCADTIPPLLLMDAVVKIVSCNRERTIPLKELYDERGKAKISKDEMVKEFLITPLPEGCKWNLFKVGRRKALAISRLTLGMVLKLNEDLIEDIRICPGAMLPVHGRLWKTENEYKGKEICEDIIEKIAEMGTQEAILLAGRRWSTAYKEPVLRGLIKRSLEELWLSGGRDNEG